MVMPISEYGSRRGARSVDTSGESGRLMKKAATLSLLSAHFGRRTPVVTRFASPPRTAGVLRFGQEDSGGFRMTARARVRQTPRTAGVLRYAQDDSEGSGGQRCAYRPCALGCQARIWREFGRFGGFFQFPGGGHFSAVWVGTVCRKIGIFGPLRNSRKVLELHP
jgi:hypothetical protein